MASSQVANYLFGEREGKVSDQLVQRLKKLHSVSRGVDINTPNLRDDAVIAVVAGQPVTAAMLNERMKPIVYKLKLVAYESARKKLNNSLLINCFWRKQLDGRSDLKK